MLHNWGGNRSTFATRKGRRPARLLCRIRGHNDAYSDSGWPFCLRCGSEPDIHMRCVYCHASEHIRPDGIPAFTVAHRPCVDDAVNGALAPYGGHMPPGRVVPHG